MGIRLVVAAASLLALSACEGLPGGTPVPRGLDKPDARPVPVIANQGCDALVAIQADNTAEGVARERAWLNANYPGFEVLNETQDQCGDVTVDRVVFVHGGIQQTVMFDTTSFYGRVGGSNLDDLLDG